MTLPTLSHPISLSILWKAVTYIVRNSPCLKTDHQSNRNVFVKPTSWNKIKVHRKLKTTLILIRQCKKWTAWYYFCRNLNRWPNRLRTTHNGRDVRACRWRRKGDQVLKSKYVLLTVALFCVTDCALVLGELILDLHKVKGKMKGPKPKIFDFRFWCLLICLVL